MVSGPRRCSAIPASPDGRERSIASTRRTSGCPEEDQHCLPVDLAEGEEAVAHDLAFAAVGLDHVVEGGGPTVVQKAVAGS
jgi:hypothetical protein